MLFASLLHRVINILLKEGKKKCMRGIKMMRGGGQEGVEVTEDKMERHSSTQLPALYRSRPQPLSLSTCLSACGSLSCVCDVIEEQCLFCLPVSFVSVYY